MLFYLFMKNYNFKRFKKKRFRGVNVKIKLFLVLINLIIILRSRNAFLFTSHVFLLFYFANTTQMYI